MKGDRALHLAFIGGRSLSDIDDETGMRSGYSEERLRAYDKLLQERPRTHYRHRGSDMWLCGSGKVTRDKDRVTCRRCLAYVDRLGGPVVAP